MKSTETARRQKGKATKKRIFAVAKELILAKGYNNVTVDEICEACSLSKGAFYIHYKSKEDIVRKLYLDDISEYLDENFKKFLDDNQDASPVDKLKTFIRLSLRFPSVVGEELTKLAFVVSLSHKSPENTSFLSECIGPERLQEMIEEGKSQSLFKSVLSTEECVNYIYSFVAGAYISWCLSDAAYDIEQANEKFVDLLMKSLQ